MKDLFSNSVGKIVRKMIILAILFLSTNLRLLAQTPGMIFDPSTGSGPTVILPICSTIAYMVSGADANGCSNTATAISNALLSAPSLSSSSQTICSVKCCVCRILLF